MEVSYCICQLLKIWKYNLIYVYIIVPRIPTWDAHCSPTTYTCTFEMTVVALTGTYDIKRQDKEKEESFSSFYAYEQPSHRELIDVLNVAQEICGGVRGRLNNSWVNNYKICFPCLAGMWDISYKDIHADQRPLSSEAMSTHNFSSVGAEAIQYFYKLCSLGFLWGKQCCQISQFYLKCQDTCFFPLMSQLPEWKGSAVIIKKLSS